MKIEEKTILWKPVSEYTGGRVLATNGLDILVGELNPEGDCVSEDCSGIHLCGITHFAKIAGFFPELKESEDERIRNQIINFIEEYGNPIHCEWQKDWIAWLEKQGEQKPTDNIKLSAFKDKLLELFQRFGWYCKDKTQTDEDIIEYIDAHIQELIDTTQKSADNVEPKFHEGEWITNSDYTWKIVEVKPLDYILQSQDGNIVDDTISHVDEQFHSFTIEDAKDGDVLAFDDNTIVIFKDLYNANTFHSYCYIEDGVFSISQDDMPDWWKGKGFHPATKEQHDLLFQKMHEARYEWDAEKKELKKIEQKPTIEPKFKVGDYIDRKDGLGCHAKIIVVGKNVYGCEKLIYSEDESPFFDLMFENQDEFRISPDCQQNHTWSEEDEEMFEKILQQFMTANNECKLHNASFTYDKEISFLKSLKGRVQPKQEWSEEDERMLHNLLECLRRGWRKLPADILKYESWLKSLRPQNHWKPTEAQLASLRIACDRNDRVGFDLTQLLKELKEL